MNKILFLMNDSEAYLRDEVIRTYQEWGFTSSTVKTATEWDPTLSRGALSLFGDVSMTHLDLSDKKDLKTFADLISDKKKKEMFEGDWFAPGLIITSIHAQGTKKVEDLVKKSGGEIVKKAKPEDMKKILFARVNLNTDTKKFMSEYAGDDYQMIIGVINQIEKMDKKEQIALTIEDVIVRLPVKPGGVPPWDFINPMLNGNAKEAVDLYVRAVESSHVLVTMQLARKKLQLLYRLKVLLAAGISNNNEQASILNEKNGPNIWITAKTASKISIPTAEYLAELALITEANLKGYSNADPNITFINFIAATSMAIRYNTPFLLDTEL